MREMIKLINDLLRPRLKRFHLLRHVPKLVPDNRLLDQSLTKRLALRGPRHSILETRPRAAQTLEHDPQALVVEVAHYVSETLAFGADKVLDGHLDVLQDHVGGGREAPGTDFDFARANAFGAWDNEEGNSLCAWPTGTDSSLGIFQRLSSYPHYLGVCSP